MDALITFALSPIGGHINSIGHYFTIGALGSSCGFVGAYIYAEIRKAWGRK